MTNQTKQGFSLVEVMILFTVLAVTMAATLPVITKKSKPVPTKVPHGVYRCIANADGKTYTEETYNSFKLLNRNDKATSCNFSVPKRANIYKIDLYGAGAGGTKYAAYKPLMEDERNAYFRMSHAVQYAKSDGSKLPFVTDSSLPSYRQDMPYTLDNKDIVWAYNGNSLKEAEKIIITAYSSDAGKGGDARFSYTTPANSICTAFEAGEAVYAKKESDTYAEYEKLNAIYLALDKEYQDKIDNLKAEANTYKTGIENNNKILENITTHVKSLNAYIDKMKTLKSNIDKFKSTSSVDKSVKEDLYKNKINGVIEAMSLSDEGVQAANDYINPYIYYTKASGQATYSPTYNYSDISGREYGIKYNMSIVNAWVNNDANHIKYYYDDEGNVAYSEVKSYQEKVFDLFELIQNPASNDIKSKFSSVTTDSGRMYADTVYYVTLVSIKKAYNQLETNINNANTDMSNKKSFIESGDKYKEGTLANAIYVKSVEETTPGAPLYEAKKKSEKAWDDYQDAVAAHNQYKENVKNEVVRPSQYNGKTNLMFDTMDQTNQQIKDFCYAKYKDFYDIMKNEGKDVSLYENTGGQKSVDQSGGKRGSGVYLQLIYPLYYGNSEKLKYPDLATVKKGLALDNQQFAKYPYAKFIGDLYGNIKGRGFQVAACKNNTYLNSVNCETGKTISDAKAGIYISESDPSKLKTEDYKKYILTNDVIDTDGKYKGEGKDQKQFLAYHVPDFESHDTVGKYVTILDSYSGNAAATGGKKAAVGYNAKDAMYAKGDYTSNVAWDVFQGDGTKSGASAESGKNATVPAKYAEMELNARYNVKKVDKLFFQEPEINMNAQLWVKKYNLGQEGGRGQKVHVQTTTMGTSCKIRIPHAGPMFDYFAYNTDAQRQAKLKEFQGDIELSDFGKIGKLDAKIICVDDEKVTVLNKTAKGGAYNINVNTNWGYIFYWKESDKPIEHVAKSDSTAYKANYSGEGSRWAKIFYSKITGTSTLTMSKLTSYNVGNGGSYTWLLDRCTPNKGKMRLVAYEMTSNTSQASVTATKKIRDTNEGMTYNGMLDGVDCYIDDNKKYESIFTLNPYKKSSIVHDHTKDEEDKNYKYVLYPPSEAGGGAVVITW